MNENNKKRPTLGRAEPASAGAQRQDAGGTRGQANGAGRGAKKRLTASEREALMRLNVARDILTLEPAHLTARMALVPGAKRDTAMMAAKVKTLMKGIEATIPADQMMTYLRNIDSACYAIGVKRPGTQQRDETNYGMWIPYAVLNALLVGCHDHCMMCNLDIVGRKQCPLRKALHTIPNDSNEERSDGDCPYFTEL